ncbi:Hpt domain-containing protein [Burkholderiaceae bacterium FT117]|uniref:Hpt domain-containing protein n=1 Tax=Zeimonas sediminis TaxID=2944268 RepID=UPI002342FD97|nr:Hpt domain-containing protein [Zeimonas sediminis]MCM5572396.1 Hpt domain-containing protein [Zeimonas sediminis]
MDEVQQFDAAPDLSVLSWCAAEIRQSLQNSVDSLRRQLAAGPDDASALRAARTGVHQAHGALAIVGLSGVPALTAEAERFIDAIERGAASLDEAAVEAFAGACGAVAEYLDGLLAGDAHQPLYLFPYYRDLLAARGESRIQASDLFVVPAPAGPIVEPPPIRVTDGGQLAAARADFERGLLKLMRDPADRAALDAMRAAVDTVLHSERGARQAVFWRAALACFEAWAGGSLPLDVAAKRLLARINLQIRQTVSELLPVGERLLAETLFLLAGAGAGSQRVAEVREAFRLDGAIPSDYEVRRFGGTDPAALDAARAALATARLRWDAVGAGAAAARLEASEAFADAVGRLPSAGLQRMAAGLVECARAACAPERQAEEALALEAASGLLFAEQFLERGPGRTADLESHAAELGERLSVAAKAAGELPPLPDWMRALGQAAQERVTMSAFVAETRATLNQVEQSLDAFFRDPAQREGLPGAVRHLRQVGGALRLLGHAQAGDAADAVAGQVEGFAAAALPATGEAADEADTRVLEETVAVLDPARFEDVAASLGALGFFVDGLLAPERAGIGVVFDPDTGRIEASVHGSSDAAGPRRQGVSAASKASAVSAAAEAGTGEAPAAGPRVDMAHAAGGATIVEATSSGDAAGVPAAPQPQATESPDPELLEIFLGEAAEVLDAIEQAVGMSREAPSDPDAMTAIRRGFHTLKGSGRMVGLVELGEAAWSLEQTMNLWLAESRAATPELQDLIELAAALFRGWIGALADEPGARMDPTPVVEAAEAIRDGRPSGESLARLVAAGTGLAIAAADESNAPDAATDRPELGLDETVEIEAAIAVLPDEGEGGSQDASDFVEVLDIGEPIDVRDADEVVEEPEIVEVVEVPETVEVVEVPEAVDAVEVVEAADFVAIEEGDATAASATPDLQAESVAPVEVPAESAAPSEAADEVRIGALVLSRALYEIFLNEADSLIATLLADADAWAAMPARAATDEAQRAVHSLKGSAAVVSLRPVQAMADRLEAFLLAQRASGRAVGPEDIADYAQAIEAMQAMLRRFAAGAMPGDEPAALALAHQLAARWESSRGAQRRSGTAESGELDADLLPLFIEEATDILPQIGENLRRWQAQPADRALQQLLMRQLHTVKGSARMAGAMVLGQRVHEMETRVEAASGLTVVPTALIDELVAEHDEVVGMFEAIRERGVAAPPAAAPASSAGEDLPAPATGEGAQRDDLATGSRLPEAAPFSEAEPPAALASPAAVPAQAAQAGAQAPASGLVRVRADLLDRLVNESGEVSIARSRLDNELSQLRQSLQDLTENVGRLRGQLREIEIQAESQIQARNAQRRDRDSEFDPLEFDRFTRFQELTRMLAESVNDVATVQQNAMRSLDGATQDMHRQAQVLRELQQNLMRMRMVQFGSISDRLYRVVRQAAKELGKRVSMDLRGASVEIDRGVLERMAAPIEHLLRNAVAHGIEKPAARVASGKAEAGEIRLEVRQEGNEVVLVFADDGGGLDTARIVAKARASGLLAEGRDVSDAEARELIFLPGFSTAGSVDEISGRGVGLDVVRTEVASLGGRIDIESAPGAGTRFVVHLPLTLAIAQVVLVTVGPLKYAIPSSSVEQVLQLRPQVLADAYDSGSIDWQGARVPMHYLGTLVDARDLQPVAQHQSPVVVIRSGNQRLALHVDTVSPTQEVVVKNVGPQVARVRGIGGATVLGNGEIVLILNAVRLAQAVLGDAWLDRGASGGTSASLAEVPPTVMVVDDSLTVRKVTQRLLVREGYDVMLAKDGVDALRQLQDRRPDVMLVDIEMPRMDGFDLTRNLRGDERYRDIPIVMITSRTADKHRNYAMSLGVDVYLGKPYRDDELLGHVAAFTRGRAARAG